MVVKYSCKTSLQVVRTKGRETKTLLASYSPSEGANDGLKHVHGALVRLLAGQETLEDGEEGFQLLGALDLVSGLGDDCGNEPGEGRDIAPRLPGSGRQDGLDQRLEVARDLVGRVQLEKEREDLEDEGDEFCKPKG